MCPFSHGIMHRLNTLLSLLLLSVFVGDGGLVCADASIQNRKRIIQSAQRPLTYHPAPQVTVTGTKESHLEQRVGSDRSSTAPQKMKQPEKLKQSEVALFLSRKHRGRENGGHKHSSVFDVTINQPGLFEYSNHKNYGRIVTDLQRTMLPGSSVRFSLLEQLRKFKVAHQRICKVCTLKFGHRQLLLDSLENRHSLHNRKKNSLRTGFRMSEHHRKSGHGVSRTKRSPKKNKHPIANKSSKLTKKRFFKKKRRPVLDVKVKQGDKLTAEQGGLSVKQTTDTAAKRPKSNATQELGQKISDSVTSKAVYMPKESVIKINMTTSAEGKIVEAEEQSFGMGLSQGLQINLESSQLSQHPVSSQEHEDSSVESGTYMGLDGKPVNLRELVAVLKRSEYKRELKRKAQWAYMCLVVLVCLMLWVMWCVGGLEHCRYRPDSHVHFSDTQPLVSVKDVLRNQRRYLPMFNEPEWEEVLMCNRGNDP